MRNRTGQKQKVKARAGKKVSQTCAAKKAEAKPAPTPASERFVRDLLVRGEAANIAPNGKLPLDATHVIESENEDGTAAVRRVRYKLF